MCLVCPFRCRGAISGPTSEGQGPSLPTIEKAAQPKGKLDRRCCRTLRLEDSHRESMRLDGLYEQAITRPLPHNKLVQLHCLASQPGFAVDLVGQGHDLDCAA